MISSVFSKHCAVVSVRGLMTTCQWSPQAALATSSDECVHLLPSVVDSRYKGHDLSDAKIPWPLFKHGPLYGDGLVGYRRLVVPNYELVMEWAVALGKRALTEASSRGKVLITQVSSVDVTGVYVLAVSKGKESSQMFLTRVDSTKDVIMKQISSVRHTGMEAVTKVPSLEWMSKYNRNLRLVFGDQISDFTALKLKTVKKWVNKVKPKPVTKDYTYVSQYYNNSSRPFESIGNFAPKPEMAQSQQKQDIHTLASDSTALQKQMDLRFHELYHQFWIYARPVWSVPSELSSLVPEPVKKIWRGLRDKNLPSWQATIASMMQKMQDALIKKKK